MGTRGSTHHPISPHPEGGLSSESRPWGMGGGGLGTTGPRLTCYPSADTDRMMATTPPRTWVCGILTTASLILGLSRKWGMWGRLGGGTPVVLPW